MGMLAYIRNSLKKGKSKEMPSARRQETVLVVKPEQQQDVMHRETDDGWDFGARQTPDRSLHSVTPSDFSRLSPVCFSSTSKVHGEASRSSSAQSLHPTKPIAESKRLPIPPPEFGEMTFQSISAHGPDVDEISEYGARVAMGRDSSRLSPGLPDEGVVLVTAGAIARESRQWDDKCFVRRRRAQSLMPDAQTRRPELRHMASSSTVNEQYSKSAVPPLPMASSTGPFRYRRASQTLGSSFKPQNTTLNAKRSMPQLEGVWENFLEETAEDAKSLSNSTVPKRLSSDYFVPPHRQSSRLTTPEVGKEFARPWKAEYLATRPAMPRHSSSPSTSSTLTIASVASSKYSPSLTSTDLHDLMDTPPPRPSAPSPTASSSHRIINQSRKARSSKVSGTSHRTTSSSSSMVNSLFSSGLPFDQTSLSSMTTVQDEDEGSESCKESVASTMSTRIARKRPQDLTIVPKSFSRGAVYHSHQTLGRRDRHLLNGQVSPSSPSTLSFSSHATSSNSRSACDADQCPSPSLTPLGTPTPTTASFPITPPLSRSSSRSTPHLRQRSPWPSRSHSPGPRQAVLWSRTPPIYDDEMPIGSDETISYGFPRTPSLISPRMSSYLKSDGGGKSAKPHHRRHMQQPSDSSSCSEDPFLDPTQYHRYTPSYSQNTTRQSHELSHGRSKSAANLKSFQSRKHDTITFPDMNALDLLKTTRSPAQSKSLDLHDPLASLPQDGLQREARVVRRPAHARRMHSESDATTPYNSSSSSPSSSPHASPLRRPMQFTLEPCASPSWTKRPTPLSNGSVLSDIPASPSPSPLVEREFTPLKRPPLDGNGVQQEKSFHFVPLMSTEAGAPAHGAVQWGYAL